MVLFLDKVYSRLATFAEGIRNAFVGVFRNAFSNGIHKVRASLHDDFEKLVHGLFRRSASLALTENEFEEGVDFIDEGLDGVGIVLIEVSESIQHRADGHVDRRRAGESYMVAMKNNATTAHNTIV